jgi:hypothetical protein
VAAVCSLKMEAICSPKRRFIQYLHGATSQKKAFFIVTAVKTSNLTRNSMSVIKSEGVLPFHMNPPMDQISDEINPVHNNTHLYKIHFNSILPSIHVSTGSSGSLKKENSLYLVLETFPSTFYLLSVTYK